MYFIFLPENAIFLMAFALIMLFGLVEVTSMIFGMSLFSQADAALLPYIDAGDSSFAQALDWLNPGKVPLLILLILFLTCFSLGGVIMQWLIFSLFSVLPYGVLTAIPAALLAILSVKNLNGPIGRLIPAHESRALSEASFIGCMAIVTGGTARVNHPAQCRLVDSYQQTHYFLVQPDDEEETFSTGDRIIITAQLSPALFQGMHNPWPEHL